MIHVVIGPFYRLPESVVREPKKTTPKKKKFKTNLSLYLQQIFHFKIHPILPYPCEHEISDLKNLRWQQIRSLVKQKHCYTIL
jgi:hypothetical protein